MALTGITCNAGMQAQCIACFREFKRDSHRNDCAIPPGSIYCTAFIILMAFHHLYNILPAIGMFKDGKFG